MRSNPQVQNQGPSPYANTFAALITDEQQMNLYLSALYPIARPQEEQMCKELVRLPGHMEEKQAFLYQFWQSRDALNPEGKWRQYRDRIDYVERKFSYPRTHGYLTDMGRVYLQYGPPSHVRDEKNFVSTRYLGSGDYTQQLFSNDATKGSSHGQIFYLPYQLWRYDVIPGDDANRCFLFWDEQHSGIYRLLHSNVKGEVQESGWERRLSQNQLGEDVIGEVGQQFQRGF